MKRQSIFSIVFLLAAILPLNAAIYNVIDFGAKGDGCTLDTKSVQTAIDSCFLSGGGTVLIPASYTILIGTIYLKDGVNLHIENGGILRGSPDITDYASDTYKNLYKNEPHMDRCLIFARDAKSFSITGKGIIDGNGYRSNFNRNTGRPMLIRFMNCKDITMRDITLINPAAWVSAWLYCDQIVVEGIRIHSRVNGNGDGLDFDGCTKVRVSNSSFDTSDDSICLQASRQDKPCKDIVVSNCTFCSKWAGMRIGLLSRGDFESVTVTNCTFNDINDSGLKIQMNEGGEMKNMVFSNLVMNNVPRPIFITFCQQRACVDSPEEMYPMDRMHNLIFQGIIVDNTELDKNSAIFITGLHGKNIEHIMLSDIQLNFAGGGNSDDAARLVKEYTLDVLEGWWPEFHLVGTLPSYGIYARHIDGLYLDNIMIRTTADDERPAVILDDVENEIIKSVFGNEHEYMPDSFK